MKATEAQEKAARAEKEAKEREDAVARNEVEAARRRQEATATERADADAAGRIERAKGSAAEAEAREQAARAREQTAKAAQAEAQEKQEAEILVRLATASPEVQSFLAHNPSLDPRVGVDPCAENQWRVRVPRAGASGVYAGQNEPMDVCKSTKPVPVAPKEVIEAVELFLTQSVYPSEVIVAVCNQRYQFESDLIEAQRRTGLMEQVLELYGVPDADIAKMRDASGYRMTNPRVVDQIKAAPNLPESCNAALAETSTYFNFQR